MRVVIDMDEAGNIHFIDTDPANYILVEHPNGSGPTTVDKMLKHHDNHPKDREIGGWHVMNQLPGEDHPMTRWDRLVAACNHPDAHPQAKALALGQNDQGVVGGPGNQQ